MTQAVEEIVVEAVEEVVAEAAQSNSTEQVFEAARSEATEILEAAEQAKSAWLNAKATTVVCSCGSPYLPYPEVLRSEHA